MDLQEILHRIQDPPESAKGSTRWWWYGAKIDRAELAFELDEMRRAGIGGVEIQMTYPLDPGDDTVAYFSPEYFDLLDFVLREAGKRGLAVDLTLGSSWPFGGPFVPFAKSARHVIPYTLDIHGPCTFTYDFTNRIAGEIVGCVLGKTERCEMLPETARDVSGYLRDVELFRWPWGIRIEGLEVPEGDWKLAVFVASQFGEHVLMPMRGAEGYVIDHNSREAGRFFFEQAGTPLVERLGRGRIRNFFCDSLEVFGHNWTPRLYEEFEARRGYSLSPYLYALWGSMKGVTGEVRYDFHKTLSELTVEGFFKTMTEWCHEAGSLSRIQAHGTWGDVLEAYGAADVPEGETFSPWDKLEVNTVHRRLASSAAHLYGRPVVSNESFTWLRFPRFTETPEQIKLAADAIFLDGMNQIVNHGYSYSPRSGEEKYFYASSQLNHTCPWWKYYPLLASYIQRACAFLRQGEPVAQVCVYLPQGDIWAENPLGDTHMCMKLGERLGAFPDRLAKRGYWFDYINDECLQRFDRYKYEALILPFTERIPPETARAVRDAADSGIPVFCLPDMPSMACGLKNHDRDTEEIRSIFGSLRDSGRVTIAATDSELFDALDSRLTPLVRVEGAADSVGWVIRRDGGTTLVFTANVSTRARDTELILRDRTEPFVCLDLFAGKPVHPVSFAYTQKNVRIRLAYEPGQSLLLVFDRSLPQPIPAPAKKSAGALTLIPDGWTLAAPGTDPVPVRLDEGFERIDALRYYAGEVVYSARVTLPEDWQPGGRAVLSMENVACAATVSVNGVKAGELIKRPWTVEIGALLRPGANRIAIAVTNTMINRVLSPDWKTPVYEDTVVDEWPYFTAPVNKERMKRLSNRRELASVKEPVPSGLFGPVVLTVG